MTKEERIQKLRKFTQDPDFVLISDMLNEQLQPLRDVMNIDTTRSNDEIASEIRGRQISINSLSNFLRDTKLVNEKIIKSNASFK